MSVSLEVVEWEAFHFDPLDEELELESEEVELDSEGGEVDEEAQMSLSSEGSEGEDQGSESALYDHARVEKISSRKSPVVDVFLNSLQSSGNQELTPLEVASRRV